MKQEPEERSAYFDTPLANALLSLSETKINSFHTLPLSQGRSISASPLSNKYYRLLGEHYIRSDLTITRDHFDSFFFGKQVIHESEQLMAALFGADGTYFVTSGTTVCNQIAIDALCEKGARALFDKTCHQSLHFSLSRTGAKIDYLNPAWSCSVSERNMWSPADLLRMVLDAQNEGDPYQIIVLTAHSYDGVVYDIPGLIRYLLENGARTMNFLIDEAWGAANYFQNDLKELTAIRAGRLRAQWPDLKIVATQSAHKSMSCLRQASMIHYCGDASLATRLKISRFRLHTTSPSYPLLASLDLARAQMAVEGEDLMQRATTLAATFRQQMADLLGPQSVHIAAYPVDTFPYSHTDPTKISVNIESLGVTTREFKEILFSEYGIYVNRITESAILVNFHIGVDDNSADQLFCAMQNIAITRRANADSSRSKGFIIPYPPGVPLVVPGDQITTEIQKKIETIQRSGIHVFYA
jgi:arginine/lysine/ornithine decarboxylase